MTDRPPPLDEDYERDNERSGGLFVWVMASAAILLIIINVWLWG